MIEFGVNETIDAALGSENRAERALIVGLARIPAHDDLSRLATCAASQIDWNTVVNLAHLHGVAGLLFPSLVSLGDDRVPEAVVRELRASYHAQELAMQALIEELSEIWQDLRSISVPAMVFKGPALAVDAYGDLGLRKAGDLDLLVRKSDFMRASRVLIDRGYVINRGFQKGMRLEDVPSYIETKKGVTFYGEWCPVDLHWTLDEYPLNTNLEIEEVWKRSITVSLGSTVLPTIAHEDLIHFLCCHAAKHSWSTLYLLCDVAQLIRTHADIDWGQVVEQSRRASRERMVYLGLLLASELLDAPLPEDIRHLAKRERGVTTVSIGVARSIFDGVGVFRIHALRLFLLQRMREKLDYLAHRWKLSRQH